MPELAAALVIACLVLLLVVLELPAVLAITIRQDDLGFSLRIAVGLLCGVLRFHIVSIAAEKCSQVTVGRALSDLASSVFQSITRNAGDCETHGLPLRRRLLRLTADAVAHSAGKAGYRCTRFEARISVGLVEASDTALATGLVYACLGVLDAPFRRLMRFAPNAGPRIDLCPSYESARTTAAIDCIFRISLGYIIRREAARLLRRRFVPGKVA